MRPRSRIRQHGWAREHRRHPDRRPRRIDRCTPAASRRHRTPAAGRDPRPVHRPLHHPLADERVRSRRRRTSSTSSTSSRPMLIIAAAGTLVLVAGGIDLSVGATYSFAGVVSAHYALTTDPAIAIALGVGAGVLVGLANGLVTTVLRDQRTHHDARVGVHRRRARRPDHEGQPARPLRAAVVREAGSDGDPRDAGPRSG